MQNGMQGFPVGLHCAYVAHVWRQLPEVELQCGFSLFGRCLSRDVRCGGNLEKVGDNVYTKHKAIFSHWIALHFICAHLSSIFDIPELELECSIGVFWLVLSGDICMSKHRESGENCLCKMQGFPIGLHCAYVAHVWH